MATSVASILESKRDHGIRHHRGCPHREHFRFWHFTLNTLVKHNDIVGPGGFGLGDSQCAIIENVVLFNPRGGINLGGGTFSGNVVASNGTNNAFVALTVVSAHNNSCNDAGC